MMRLRQTLFGLVIVILLAGSSLAQVQDLTVGEIDFPQREWGKHPLPFEVTNTAEWPRFLVVETDISFEESYVNPKRIIRTNFVIAPETTAILSPVLDIPPNYGKLTVWVRIYDVVDTLDDLSLGTKVMEQPFKLRFNISEGVVPYFQEKITLPPLVGHHGLFDSEMTRLLPVLINEGKSIDEIAALVEADPAFIQSLAGKMEGLKYLVKSDDGYRSNVPVISLAYATAGRQLADEVSDKLAELITTNLPAGRRALDSLVEVGALSGDSANFLEGGGLFYHNYPLVGGMLLWKDLGQKFIAGRGLVQVYRNTDLCRPNLGPFLYIVQGGDYYNGSHYYNLRVTGDGLDATFGTSIPVIECQPGFEKKKSRLQEQVDWWYVKEYRTESFVYDRDLMKILLQAMTNGSGEIMSSARDGLKALNAEYQPGLYTMGTRFWFWNLTATRTMAKLVFAGTLVHDGNGQFKLTEKK